MASHFLEVEFQVTCHRVVQGMSSLVVKLLIGVPPTLISFVSLVGLTMILGVKPPLGTLIILTPSDCFLLTGFPVYTSFVTGYVCLFFFVIVMMYKTSRL